MKKVEEIVTNYLLQNKKFEGIKVNDGHFEIKERQCIKRCLDQIFELDKESPIPCQYYDQVVNGEGNEKKKITAVYSSSLQSLLFFAWVSKDNPLKIVISGKEIHFTDVCFEYKNKVINSPSSVDVVLTDYEGNNILFVESKLIEIIRDSDKKGKPVIGKTYFKDDEPGSYCKALSLSSDDLTKIKIVKGEEIIKPLFEERYVYSYGIKQMLSHIIGIQNYINGKNGKNCSHSLDSFRKSTVYFMELYNAFPGIEGVDEDFLQPQMDYENHIRKVIEVLQDANANENAREKELLKEISKRALIMTYQDLYLESQKGYRPYQLSSNIVDFYHLKG